MGGLDNRWTAPADAGGPVVTGQVGVGDAATHTNPTMGQGVSPALWAAQWVVRHAEDAAGGPAAFADAYHRWAGRRLRPWFDVQAAMERADEARLRNLGREPDRPPPAGTGTQDGARESAREKAALSACSWDDPVVMRARARVRHLVQPADLAYGTEEVRAGRRSGRRNTRTSRRGSTARGGRSGSRPCAGCDRLSDVRLEGRLAFLRLLDVALAHGCAARDHVISPYARARPLVWPGFRQEGRERSGRSAARRGVECGGYFSGTEAVAGVLPASASGAVFVPVSASASGAVSVSAVTVVVVATAAAAVFLLWTMMPMKPAMNPLIRPDIAWLAALADSLAGRPIAR